MAAGAHEEEMGDDATVVPARWRRRVNEVHANCAYNQHGQNIYRASPLDYKYNRHSYNKHIYNIYILFIKRLSKPGLQAVQ